MIVVKLMGGLGNQMFQYALGKRLSIDLNTPFKLDINYLNDRTPRPHNVTFRNYDLDIFKLNPAFADSKDLSGIDSVPPVKIFPRVVYTLKRRLKKNIVTEPYFHFAPGILNVGADSYLDGYWQSDKYFKKYEDVLRQEFVFKYPLDNIAVVLAKKMIETNSVCIHARRADFVTNRHANKFHGVCGGDYFNKAIKYFEENAGKPTFYVFSDDIDWCKNNLRSNNEMIYVGDEYTGYKCSSYLQLMSCCKHFIISNSTFSWWAVWLNKNNDKIVVAPKYWFVNPKINTSDLIPPHWIRF